MLANLVMLPLGWLAVKLATRVLNIARNILMPTILVFCIVGAFAVTNSTLGVVLILCFGVIGFVMEENGFPIAPVILGAVLGKMLEENLVTSLIKSDGDALVFFTRPIAMWLAAATLLIVTWPLFKWLLQQRQRPGAEA
jgi:TctA family transporter